MVSGKNIKDQTETDLLKKDFSVLVVDDDLSMRNSLSDLLAVYDMDCTLAEDGQHALEILNNNIFDLVLLDIRMPKKNGLQVMSEIHANYSATDVIILSGESSFENSREAFRFGVNDFLDKPYNPSELIDLIHKIKEKKRLKAKQAGVLLNSSIQGDTDKTLIKPAAIISNENLTFTSDIINSSPAVAFLWKNVPHWPVQFVSENVLNLLGYTAHEFMTGEIVYADLIHHDDLDRVLKEIVTDNTTKNFKHKPYRMITKSGEIRWIDDSTSIVRDEQGNITHYQGIIMDVTECELAKEEMLNSQLNLQYTAYHDDLTGLPNRLLLMDRMQQAIKKAQRDKQRLAILYIDLDKFKLINDSLGHTTGDEVLIVVAERLIANIRAMDTVARIGGDEFIVLMESVTNTNDISCIAHKLNKSLNQSIPWEGHKLFISSSIGISLFPDDGETAQELIKKADNAMYQSKMKQGNIFQFYQQL